MQLGRRTGEIIRRSHVRRRSDGFQPMSDYFESRQEAPTGTIEVSVHSETQIVEDESLLRTDRSSRRFGASINCSPIPPCSNEPPAGEDTAWKGVFDNLRSEQKTIMGDSVPLHKKLRELLEENSRSFEQLRERERMGVSVSAVREQRSTSGAPPQEDQSSSISFRRTSSRLSHGPEQIRADVPAIPQQSVNVFDNSDPPIVELNASLEVASECELVTSIKIDSDNGGVSPPAEVEKPVKKNVKRVMTQAESPPTAEGKKTVKTKAAPAKKVIKRAPSTKTTSAFFSAFDTEPQLKGVVLLADAGRTGRYQRRRHYAPLFDFLCENVTRDSAGDLCLQIADLKSRPAKRRYPTQKPVPNQTVELDGITAEQVDEDEKQITYRFRLASGKIKSLAKAQLPVNLWAESRLKRCLIVGVGKSSHNLRRVTLDGRQSAEIAQGEIYSVENPGRKSILVSLQVFKSKT